jgi:hypothetical protein
MFEKPEGVVPVEKSPGLEQIDKALESSLAPELESLANSTNELEEVCEGQEDLLPPETRSKLESLRRKLSRLVDCTVFLSIFALGGNIVLQVKDLLSFEHNDEVTATSSVDGVKFEHNDSQTTRMLNYLAGKDTLSETEVLEILRKDWEGIVEKPEALQQNLSADALTDSVSRYYKHKGKNSPAIFKRVFMREFRNFPRHLEYSDDIYRALWKMEQEVGAPKVRFMNSADGNRMGVYHPSTNTVAISATAMNSYRKGTKLTEHMNSEENIGVLFAEYSHAKQFNDTPVRSRWKNLQENEQTEARSDSLNISLDEAQKYEYDIPGSIENEAHRIITPQLKQRFKEILQEEKATSKKRP